MAPGPSAGCSRRVSCESRKGTCGRRARSAAITPPRANSERLIVRASRRRWAPSRSPRDVLAAPAFQARSDPARSTRWRVPAGASEPDVEGALVSGAASPPTRGAQVRASVPAVPGPRGGDAVRSVSVTKACDRELCRFLVVAAVARLLLPRLSIWRAEQ